MFGEQVTIILDWYHLGCKVRKLLGSIARNTAEKSEHLKLLFSNLWQGKTAAAIDYLNHQIKTKNHETLKGLTTHFQSISQKSSIIEAVSQLENQLAVVVGWKKP